MQKWLGFFYFDIHFLFAFFVFFSSEICLKLVDPMLGRIRYLNGGVSRMAPKIGTAVCGTACTVV